MKPKNFEHYGTSLRSSLPVPSSTLESLASLVCLSCPNTMLRSPGNLFSVPGEPQSEVKGLASLAVDFSGLKKMLLLCPHTMAMARGRDTGCSGDSSKGISPSLTHPYDVI